MGLQTIIFHVIVSILAYFNSWNHSYRSHLHVTDTCTVIWEGAIDVITAFIVVVTEIVNRNGKANLVSDTTVKPQCVYKLLVFVKMPSHILNIALKYHKADL